ncbi:MAG: DUF58 domain-containing protein [Bacteroidales bacterium]|jgi:uncharacterized protein (DUF58 family)|nr:DUF58 domain-containing protein [Bacteroidales bacterium]NLM93625.1 DUF58 domain-containing protein [Bacteroidales bacterium]
METTELLKKVRKIEIKTKGLSNHIFSGHYHSAFKGRGMAFTEVREYQYGDDIRSIDWNVTARFNHPYVKVFEEERELTVMLLIDVSGSNDFGAVGVLKKEKITEIAGVLAFSAINNNDKVGVIFFSDKIEKFIPPKKGSSHILRIIRELIDFKPEHKGTDIGLALKYLRNVIKKRSVAFLISDLNNRNFEEPLTIVSKKHDLVCIRVYDEREKDLPLLGLMKFRDAETGEVYWLDTASKSTREQFEQWNREQEKYLKTTFTKAGVDLVNIPTHRDYVPPLMNLFRRRSN